jgi:hypothetical protein
MMRCIWDNEAPYPCLPAGRHGAGIPGNVDIVTRSAFLSAFMTGYPPDFPVTGFRVEKKVLNFGFSY